MRNDINDNQILDSQEQIINKKVYIWIDEKIENEQNKFHYDYLFTQKNIECKKFKNVNDGFNFLNKEENILKEIVIIISGRCFNSLYYKIKNNINSIQYSPTIVIFTGNANSLINQLKMNNIYYNNDIFDTKLIFTKLSQIEDFFNNEKEPEGKHLSFETIDYLEQLIIPTYYTYLLEDVNRTEIDYFNSFLEKSFLPPTEEEIQELNKTDLKQLSFKLRNKKIQELIGQIKNKTIPKEILIKYWLSFYCSYNEFYSELNKSLRNEDKQAYFYYPFIKLCYEGVKKGFLDSYYEEIYRCSKISRFEFKKIEESFKKNQKENDFSKLIIYSRSFFSFLSNINKARTFRGATDSTYSILYIIEKIQDRNNFNNKVLNVYINDFFYCNEEEILVFPFTCFEIVDIEEIKEDKIDYKIKLKYLGNYFESEKNKLFKYLDRIIPSKYSEELIGRNILKINNCCSTWLKKEIIDIQMDKICFSLNEGEDLISFKKKDIYIINIRSSEIKQIINIYNARIIDIIQFKPNKICIFYEDGAVKILFENKENNKYYYDLSLLVYNPIKIEFLNDEDCVLVDNKNTFQFYNLKQNKSNNIKSIIEEDEILIMKKLPIDRMVYISENKNKKKFIKFIDLKQREKEINFIEINEEEKKLKVVDLIIFHDYILIVYDYRIDIMNYQSKDLELGSLKYFDYEIKNIIELSSNRIILGLYDFEKNETIIREHLLRVEDLKKNLYKFDCIGEGKIESNIIKNLLKLNESQLLINTVNNICMIYERKNEVSELLKGYFIPINKREIKIKQGNLCYNIIEQKEIKDNIFKKKEPQNQNFFHPISLNQQNIFNNQILNVNQILKNKEYYTGFQYNVNENLDDNEINNFANNNQISNNNERNNLDIVQNKLSVKNSNNNVLLNKGEDEKNNYQNRNIDNNI